LRSFSSGERVANFKPFQVLTPFKVLFDKKGNSIAIPSIKREISGFGESYNRVVKTIIDKSAGLGALSESMFKLNVATLMPNFSMTRRGAFHGVKIVGGSILDPNGALDACWIEAKNGLQDLRKHINDKSFDRTRAILELPQESRNYVIERMSELFDKLEWTTIKGSDVGPVGASKILFSVLPEIGLPVDNNEWKYVFRTHSYGRVLVTMIEEIKEWEKRSRASLETFDPKPPTTLPSIYNVMAMAARPS
jgi:hypothetical protein